MALVREALCASRRPGHVAAGRLRSLAAHLRRGGPGGARPPTPAGGGRARCEALERSVELLDLPDFAGWFLDPEDLQSDAVALLQTRESRLVVSDQIKAEREAAIIDAVVERELDPRGPRRAGRAGWRRWR